jgi:glycine/D-amino acid oxidase-like deaminating enzyme
LNSSRAVVVGAGIIGCAIARDLAIRGISCTVVDPRPVAGGATQASAGMLAPYVEAHERGPLLDLAVQSLALYDDWIAAVRAESGVDVEYRRIGTLETPSNRIRPEHGYVAAEPLALALARAGEQHGAAFIRDRVIRIVRERDGLRAITTTGAIECSHLILASGAWTNAIEGIRTPPVRPVRGQLLYLGWNAAPVTTIVWGPRCYVVPRLDGTILVGATVEEAGFDERATAEGIRELLDAVCELLPAAREATFLGARVGLRPATPDELPVLGADAGTPGVVYALGHYRNGILLAPITAKLIGDLVAGGVEDPILETFNAARFLESS